MTTFDKYIVMTGSELDSLRSSLPWESIELYATEKNGKKFKLTDIFGHDAVELGKIDPVNGATYSIRTLINNPEHADFGKYFIKVNSTDVATFLPNYVDRLVNRDLTWTI